MTDPQKPLDLVPLPGSDRPDRPGFQAHGGLAPDSRVEATLVLRRKAELPSSAFTQPLTRDELAEGYGASPEDVDLVRRTLEGLGLTVEEVDAGARRVRVSGPVQTVARVFGTDLAESTRDDAGDDAPTYRQRTGGLSIPAALSGVVTAVLGLDDRPQARAQFRYVPAAAVNTSYTPPQLGTVYSFPEGTDGSGQTIAIIELGGGYVQSDLDTYFAGLGIPTPSVRAVGVDGGSNAPDGNPNGADGEVMLDIEVA
ncbi:MAG: peptidase S53, partial [Leifsonia sp.]|nr:peptidase S53 [Leifsonia sp.]